MACVLERDYLEISEVWESNFLDEVKRMNQLADKYPYVSVYCLRLVDDEMKDLVAETRVQFLSVALFNGEGRYQVLNFNFADSLIVPEPDQSSVGSVLMKKMMGSSTRDPSSTHLQTIYQTLQVRDYQGSHGLGSNKRVGISSTTLNRATLESLLTKPIHLIYYGPSQMAILQQFLFGNVNVMNRFPNSVDLMRMLAEARVVSESLESAADYCQIEPKVSEYMNSYDGYKRVDACSKSVLVADLFSVLKSANYGGCSDNFSFPVLL